MATIGLGGVATEVFDDAAFVLAPPQPGELDRARSTRLLAGHRGRAAVECGAFHAIVDAVSDLPVQDHRVVDIDCNPVLVVDAPVVHQRGDPGAADRAGPSHEEERA